MKKIGIIFFTFVMSLIITVPVSMASSTSFEIGNADVTAIVGETIKLPVTFESDVKVRGIGLSFNYDDTVLELTDFENQASFTNAPFATTYSVEKKLISLGWMTEQDFSEEIKLCDVCFKVIGSGDIKITGKPVVKDSTGKNELTVDTPEISVSAKPNQFTGITFSDKKYTYDGNKKTITINGDLPEDAKVTYTSDGEETNSLTKVGTLNVTAKITRAGYDDLTLSAKLTVEPKEVTVNLSAEDKIYDGTTNAKILERSLVGVVKGDDVSANLPTAGTFASKNVGEGILVSVDEIKLSGADKDNYTIKQPSNLKADINKKALKIATTDVEVTYGEEINPTVTYTGFVTDEDKKILTKDVIISGYTSKPDAGDYDIILSGAEAVNYDISYTNAKLKVNKKALTITELKAFDKEVDGTTTAKVNTSSLKVNGILEDDDVLVSFENVIATFENAEIGNNIEVSITGLAITGIDAKNYNLSTTFNTNASIKERMTAAEILEQIDLENTSIDVETNKIKLPAVPNGYKISISSSSDENVIDLNGNVARVETETIVKLKYTIVREDDETDFAETNEVAVTVPATQKYKVTLKAQTKGSVTGSGEYFKNTNVTVKATPNDGYEFSGWYNGNNLVSKDASYTFKAKNNIELTAKFTKKNTSTGGGGSSSTTTYAITVKENENAEITPNGTVKVEKGDDKTFKITAKEGYEIEDVLVDGKSVGIVSKYTFENVKAKHTLEVKVKKAEVEEKEEEKPTTPEVKETFKDVKKDDWYFEAIEYVAKKGLMNGTGNDEFTPNATTTRGMIVTILYRLEGEPAVEESSFTDVPSGAYYAKAIAWAEKNGIVLGLGEGKFGPDEEITREQLATIMYRYSMYKKYDTSVGEDTNILSYNDIQDLAEYAFQAMQYACGDGLISGMGNGNLDPKGNATRAQVATILMRYCEKYMK